MRTAVVRGRDRTEAFLPCCVPLRAIDKYGEYVSYSACGLLGDLCLCGKGKEEDGIATGQALTICSFTVLPSSSIVRILKSTPMVLR